MNIYDSGYRGECPIESDEQSTFIEYLRKAYPKTYGAVVVHIENEGKRSYRQAAYAKKQGLNKGACDILIPSNISFCCELKRKDRTQSKTSQDQIDYLEAAEKLGAFVCIAYGFDAAQAAFKDWLRIMNR